MNPPPSEKDRQVIPRWRDSRTTATLGELDDFHRPAPKADRRGAELLHRKVAEWEGERALPYANEVVAAALSTGLYEQGREAAGFVIVERDAGAPARSAANRLLEWASSSSTIEPRSPVPPTVEDRQRRIRQLKAQVRKEPHNALAYADLALEYADVGQGIQAIGAMHIALTIFPTHRYLLRSAARLFIHVGDPETALEILRRYGIAKFDPWLIAAEVAVSQLLSTGSKFAKQGQAVANSGRFNAFHLSELTSALATLEASAGYTKRARALYRESLLAPTDNAVAQAEWASKRLGLAIEARHLETPLSFEARAKSQMRQGEWSEALSQSMHWMVDQPFSKDPAILASYLASVALEDYATAIRVAEVGLRANPHDWLLNNNLAFSYASWDRLDEAEARLANFLPESGDTIRRATLSATHGLIAFRRGEIEKARTLYRQAIESFRKQGDPDAAALAAIYQLREEIIANNKAVELRGNIDGLLSKDAPKEVLALYKRVRDAAKSDAGE